MAGVNMLEQMASGIVEEKAVKGRGLTPLVAELPARLRTPAAFPNDIPEDTIRGIITDLDRQHGYLGEVIASLRLLINEETPALAEKAALLTRIAEKEREADARIAAATIEKPGGDPVAPRFEVDPPPLGNDNAQAEFEENLAAQSAAAQAATFTPGTATAPAPTGWACPEGHDTVEAKTSPRGRVFMRCTTCGAFQR